MNHARMLLTLLCLTLCLTEPVHAAGSPEAAEPAIFGEWRFGMERVAALRLPGAREGSGDMAGHVLLPEIAWAGLSWNVSLEFRQGGRVAATSASGATDGGGGRLVRVCLLESYSKERLEAVNAVLREKGFEMLAMRAEDRELDFIAILKAFGSAELQKRIAGLYQTEGMSFMSFGWFDTRAISKEMKIMARNLAELLQIVRADTREAEVTLLGAEGRAGHMLVIFSLPVLEAQTGGAAGQAACPLRGETSGAASGQASQPGGKNANH